MTLSPLATPPLRWRHGKAAEPSTETLGGFEKHQVGVLVTCLDCNRYISVPTAKLIAALGRGCTVGRRQPYSLPAARPPW